MGLDEHVVFEGCSMTTARRLSFNPPTPPPLVQARPCLSTGEGGGTTDAQCNFSCMLLLVKASAWAPPGGGVTPPPPP